MIRSFDPVVMQDAMGRYPELDHPGFDYQRWLDRKSNVMLVEGDSVGLATGEYRGLYTGHFFYSVRGRKALELGRRMLDEMFTTYGAETMRGLTPVEYKPAKWVNRQLGFKSYGVIDTDTGPHELFILTKEEFYGQ